MNNIIDKSKCNNITKPDPYISILRENKKAQKRIRVSANEHWICCKNDTFTPKC